MGCAAMHQPPLLGLQVSAADMVMTAAWWPSSRHDVTQMHCSLTASCFHHHTCEVVVVAQLVQPGCQGVIAEPTIQELASTACMRAAQARQAQAITQCLCKGCAHADMLYI
jgi:hypothetical protein